MEPLPVMKLLGGCVLFRLRKFENSTGAYAARACETFSVLICGDSRSAWIPRLFSRAIRTASSALEPHGRPVRPSTSRRESVAPGWQGAEATPVR